MFKITQNKGFHMTFKNGWTMSVQFGQGNYCTNRNYNYVPNDPPADPCPDAEIAIIAPEGHKEWGYNFGGDTVQGWVTPDKVVEWMNFARMLPSEERNNDIL